MGVLIDRIHRELTAEEISKIADTYHAWRSGHPSQKSHSSYSDVPGFCKSVKLEEIQHARLRPHSRTLCRRGRC